MTDVFDTSDGTVALNLFGDITQVILHVLIVSLSIVYVGLVLLNKHLRQAKLIWPTINICLATMFFSFNQLIIVSLRLHQSTGMIISCRIHSFIIDLSASQMMYAHSVSVIIRFLVIRYFHKPWYRSRQFLLITMTAGWLVALILAIPYLLYDGFSCAISDRAELLTTYSCVTTMVLPVSIVGIYNYLIFSHIRRSTRRVHQTGQEGASNANPLTKRDLHLSRVMLITFCLFILGWTPLFVEQLAADIEHQVPLILTILFRINLPVCLLGGMVLLLYFNQQIRHLIQKMCRCNRDFPRIFAIQTR